MDAGSGARYQPLSLQAEEEPRFAASAGGDTSPLGFCRERRVATDKYWMWAFVACMGVTTLGGGYASTSYNRDLVAGGTAAWASCHGEEAAEQGLELQSQLLSGMRSWWVPVLLWAAHTLVTVCCVGFLCGATLLWLLKTRADLLVKATVGMSVGVPVAVAVVALVGLPMPAGPVVALFPGAWAAAAFWLANKYSSHLALCSRLFAAAASVLYAQPGLLWASLGLKLAYLAGAVALGGCCVAAVLNGEFRLQTYVRQDDDGGQEHTSEVCTYDLDEWAKAYLVLAGLSLTWLTMLAFELRQWVCSSVAAQYWQARWGGGRDEGAAKDAVGVALRHGLGPNFGTLCFGAAVLTLVEQMKKPRKDRNGNGSDVLGMLFMVVKWVAAEALEFLTSRATIVAAITGLPLIASGRRAIDILRPHLGATLVTWAVPGTVLGLANFTVTIIAAVAMGIWAGTAGAITSASLGETSASLDDFIIPSAIITGFVSIPLVLMILSFFSNIVLSVVDTLFVLVACESSPEELLQDHSGSLTAGSSSSVDEKAALRSAMTAMVPQEVLQQRQATAGATMV